ncbi:MAG: hypothetical protein ACHQX3_00125 [Nitrospirales bacterium]|jgi:hypothetical protein
MKICPLCMVPLNRLVGPDGYTAVLVITPWTGRVVEQKRMDVIHVCPRCEHCE